MQCFMKKEDKSLIDVDNYRRKVLPSELTNTIEQFMVYVNRIEAHFTYIKYSMPMYLRLTTFTQTLPQMSFLLYFVAIFILLWGSTHDSVDWWSAHRPPAARDSFKRVHH